MSVQVLPSGGAEDTLPKERTFDCISDETTMKIVTLITQNPELISVTVSGPYSATREGSGGWCSICLSVAMHQSIRYLNLEGNSSINDDVAPFIQTVLMVSRSIVSINIKGHSLTDKSIPCLCDGIAKNQGLVELQIGTNKFTEEGRKALQEACKEKNISLDGSLPASQGDEKAESSDDSSETDEVIDTMPWVALKGGSLLEGWIRNFFGKKDS